jgi:hypothetical protein
MSDANTTPTGPMPTQIDTEHQRGETGDHNQSTPKPKDPLAHDLPGNVPGNTGDDVGARMIPRAAGAGEVGPDGTSSEGASGGDGLPGGSAPRDDERKPKRV